MGGHFKFVNDENIDNYIITNVTKGNGKFVSFHLCKFFTTIIDI
jgi:hypothetical protein